MPRPFITLTPDQLREVETLAALLNQAQIADYLGISRRTFQAILERDAEVAAQYKRGKAKAIAHVANSLLQKARAGDTTSCIFYLKTQAGWRERAAPDASVPVGGTATERLRQLLDDVAARSPRIGVERSDRLIGERPDAPR